jgi:hypothetical protein
MDNMVTVDPFADSTSPTLPALYACWECPEICW